NYLDDLKKTEGDLPRKLDPEKAKSMKIDRIEFNEATFRKLHAADKRETDKLEEGIAGFTKAMISLEKLLGDRLDALASPERATAKGEAAQKLFKVYDMDGD